MARRKPMTEQERIRGACGISLKHQQVVDLWMSGACKDKGAAYFEVYKPSTKISAHKSADRLFKLPSVQQYIALRQRELRESARVDQSTLIERYIDIADVDVRDAFDPKTGEVLPMDKWPDSVSRACVGFDTSGRPKFESRRAALDSIGKILGVFAADNEQRSSRTEVVIKDFSGGYNPAGHDPELSEGVELAKALQEQANQTKQ